MINVSFLPCERRNLIIYIFGLLHFLHKTCTLFFVNNHLSVIKGTPNASFQKSPVALEISRPKSTNFPGLNIAVR